MSDEIADSAEAVPPAIRPRRGILRRVVAGIAFILLAILAIVWFNREEIADSLIKDQLDQLGLAASYEIESIDPRRQVLVNVVVGDPERPDLTIERVETSLVPRFPFATIGRVRLVKPRLYGTYIGGRLSFGALDPLLFEQASDEPFAFPDMDLLVEDARALIESDYGAVGIKADGEGNLQGGFAGMIAATAPGLEGAGCSASAASLYGDLSIEGGRPGFKGPLRLASLACPEMGVAASGMVLTLDGRIDRALDGLEASAGMTGDRFAWGANEAQGFDGALRFAWGGNALTSSYDLGLERVDTPQFALSALRLQGSARTREGVSRVEVAAEAKGEGLRPGPALDTALGDAAKAAQGTLAAPLIAQVRAALAREGQGSTLAAAFTYRATGETGNLVVPEARWIGASGESLLAVSRFQLTMEGEATPRFSGNFLTGGPGLPRISGRMETDEASGEAEFHLRMAEYRAQNASIELPRLVLSPAGGGYGFSGEVLASGPLPGGTVQRLAVPLQGGWSAAGGLSMWTACTDFGFEKLALSSLQLDRQRLRLCPSGRRAILSSGADGIRLAASTPGLELKGRVGESPLVLKAESLVLDYPGASLAQGVEITLGTGEAASRFVVGELTFDSVRGIGGTFSGSDTRLAAVPLDVLDARGKWSFVGGFIVLDEAEFELRDRTQPARFNPLVSRNARLVVAGSRIVADAQLRERRSDRTVASAHIVHDLGTGTGHADLAVEALQFDGRLQPDTLTDLALGVVANARGRVDGKGRIDWNPESLTSSGEFSTDDLDFAAAFGPVEGVSGTIHFTDLLGMVTAPQQVLTIRSFNPGVQVEQGNLTYELRPGFEMVIHGGVWPFIGGTLILEPTATALTGTQKRRYTLRLIAVDAAQFVERMELANIAATGRFDGRVPLVFDENGGRLEGGYLVSRPPGGNLSYVGALTYEEMNPIANFAFDALRSLDFTRMEVDLNGSLAGEIVTKVRFDGIRQGEDAKRNLVTRQLARLPIRFNVNIRAPFYQLMTSLKTMYDPAFVADPRAIGLLDDRGRPQDEPVFTAPEAAKTEDLTVDEDLIQTSDSEDTP